MIKKRDEKNIKTINRPFLLLQKKNCRRIFQPRAHEHTIYAARWRDGGCCEESAALLYCALLYDVQIYFIIFDYSVVQNFYKLKNHYEVFDYKLYPFNIFFEFKRMEPNSSFQYR